jgi:hypothetical protein
MFAWSPHPISGADQRHRGVEQSEISLVATLSAVGGLTRTFGLKSDPLDFVPRQPFAGAVVKLGRARAFMRRHFLRVLERAVIGEIARVIAAAEV